MPALKKNQAAETLAAAVENSEPNALVEIHAELFPEKSAPTLPSAKNLAQHIRTGLEAEEVVDLWNVVFPKDRNVWYDEVENEIHYNEEAVGYADTD